MMNVVGAARAILFNVYGGPLRSVCFICTSRNSISAKISDLRTFQF